MAADEKAGRGGKARDQGHQGRGAEAEGALPNGLGFGEAFRENLENSDPRAYPEPTLAPLPCANSNPGTDQNLNTTRAPTRTFNPTPDPARPEPEATPLPGSDTLTASLVLAQQQYPTDHPSSSSSLQHTSTALN